MASDWLSVWVEVYLGVSLVRGKDVADTTLLVALQDSRGEKHTLFLRSIQQRVLQHLPTINGGTVKPNGQV